jgi:hypothetical protein
MTDTTHDDLAKEIASGALGIDWRDTETAARRVAKHAAARIEELEAKLAKAVDALHSIDFYGSDTLSGCSDGLSDAKWYRYGVIEMRNRARATLAAITETPHD